MTDIGPGDKVICVDDGNQLLREGDVSIVCGKIYTVRDIIPDWFGARGLLLEGIQNPSTSFACERGYAINRFRPIRDDDIQIFRDIEANPDKPIKADQFDKVHAG